VLPPDSTRPSLLNLGQERDSGEHVEDRILL
jgi:hypothetical protein